MDRLDHYELAAYHAAPGKLRRFPRSLLFFERKEKCNHAHTKQETDAQPGNIVVADREFGGRRTHEWRTHADFLFVHVGI
jgi:hypothetical protein